jgi:hypothetical protein
MGSAYTGRRKLRIVTYQLRFDKLEKNVQVLSFICVSVLQKLSYETNLD